MTQQIITVFGGSGFLGRYVVRALAATGTAIRVACRRQRDAMFCKSMGDVGQIVPVQCNVRDKKSVGAAIKGADCVINLTGILFERGTQTFDSVHSEGALCVAKAARDNGADRLIHVSAIGADVESESVYAKSKGTGEILVQDAFPDSVILRPSLVFGPEDDFFNRFSTYARVLPFLPLIGGGNTKFQPVYVCDVAEAIVRALKDKSSIGKTFELGGTQVATFKELMQLILHTVERRKILMPVPFWFASLMALSVEVGLAVPAKLIAGLTPPPPITLDQVRLLQYDNIVSSGSFSFADLGITPVSMEAILPTYLSRYRPGGGLRDGSSY